MLRALLSTTLFIYQNKNNFDIQLLLFNDERVGLITSSALRLMDVERYMYCCLSTSLTTDNIADCWEKSNLFTSYTKFDTERS